MTALQIGDAELTDHLLLALLRALHDQRSYPQARRRAVVKSSGDLVGCCGAQPGRPPLAAAPVMAFRSTSSGPAWSGTPSIGLVMRTQARSQSIALRLASKSAQRRALVRQAGSGPEISSKVAALRSAATCSLS